MNSTSIQALPPKVIELFDQPRIDWNRVIDEVDLWYIHHQPAVIEEFWLSIRILMERYLLEKRQITVVTDCMDIYTSVPPFASQLLVDMRDITLKKLSSDEIRDLFHQLNQLTNEVEVTYAFKRMFWNHFHVKDDKELFHLLLVASFQYFDLNRAARPLFQCYMMVMSNLHVCPTALWKNNHLPILMETSPKFFTEVDDQGNTFLHKILSDPRFRGQSHFPPTSSYVVRIIVQNFPKTLRMRNKLGSLPLHCLLAPNGQDRAVPRGIGKGLKIEFYSCYNYMFRVYPEAVSASSQEYSGKSPVHCLLEQCLAIYYSPNAPPAHLLSIKKRAENAQRFLKLLLCMVAEMVQTVPACLYALDNDRYTPLHLLVASANMIIKHQEKGCGDQNQVLTFIVEAFTSATTAMMPTKTGKLPLHSLAERKECTLAQLVLRAAPKAVRYRCPVSKLYPFQLMAAALEESDEDDSNSNDEGEGLAFQAPLVDGDYNRGNDGDDDDDDEDGVDGDENADDDCTDDEHHDGDGAIHIVETTFLMLREAPDVVSTALLAAQCSYLEEADYIEGAKLQLESHRLLLKGNRLCKAVLRTRRKRSKIA